MFKFYQFLLNFSLTVKNPLDDITSTPEWFNDYEKAVEAACIHALNFLLKNVNKFGRYIFYYYLCNKYNKK